MLGVAPWLRHEDNDGALSSSLAQIFIYVHSFLKLLCVFPLPAGHGICSPNGHCDCMSGYLGDACETTCPSTTTGGPCNGHVCNVICHAVLGYISSSKCEVGAWAHLMLTVNSLIRLFVCTTFTCYTSLQGECVGGGQCLCDEGSWGIACNATCSCSGHGKQRCLCSHQYLCGFKHCDR